MSAQSGTFSPNIAHGRRNVIQVSVASGPLDFTAVEAVRYEVFTRISRVPIITLMEASSSLTIDSATAITIVFDANLIATLWAALIVLNGQPEREYRHEFSIQNNAGEDFHKVFGGALFIKGEGFDGSNTSDVSFTFSDGDLVASLTVSATAFTAAIMAAIMEAAADGAPLVSGDIFAISRASTLLRVDFDDLPGAGGGETNTASNLGAGAGVFETKTGVDLRFNSLVSQNTLLTIAEDDPNDEIDFTINEGALAINGTRKVVAASGNSSGSGLYRITGASVTLTFTSADIADATFTAYVKNESTTTVTLATEGAETIEGLASMSFGAGASILLYSDGTNLRQL